MGHEQPSTIVLLEPFAVRYRQAHVVQAGSPLGFSYNRKSCLLVYARRRVLFESGIGPSLKGP